LAIRARRSAHDLGTSRRVPRSLEANPPPDADDAPALAALDSTHILVVYTKGEGEQMAAVLDVSGALELGPARLNPSPAPPRHTPSVAITADGIYLAWTEPPPPPDPAWGWGPFYDDTLVQKLV
jgi:hypothetical protein